MNSDKNKIDKLIKAKIGDHEMMPDAGLWNLIEPALITKNKFGYIYKGITLLAVVIVSTCIFYLYSDTDKVQSSNPVKVDSFKQQATYLTDSITNEHKINESSAASYISKEAVINCSLKNDSLKAIAQQPHDSVIQPVTEIVVSKDTSAFVSVPIQNKVVKKVVKKPIYVIQQDTIYKIDSLKRRRIK